MTATDPPAELVIGDQRDSIVELLRELQRAVLLHPEATRALFKALAAEGRSFARTEEGGRWQDLVLGSALLERALLVWQSATLWLSEDADEGTTPSAIVDAVAAAARSPDRDALLEQLFRSG